MNIFETYLDKILNLIKNAKENNLLELPETLSGIIVEIPPAKFNCDMSTNVAMVLSKPNNTPPLENLGLIPPGEVWNVHPSIVELNTDSAIKKFIKTIS